MTKKPRGILDYLSGRLNDGLDAAEDLLLDVAGYNKWQTEAEDISRSLGLVYREQSPLPLPQGKKYGDPLLASNNAITHAYVSANIAQRYGSDIEKYYGNSRERDNPGDEPPWDVYKDLWNNEVGRRIGASVSSLDDAALVEASSRMLGARGI
ncbi:hypothetical protein AB4144_28975 [Rhizobiaceae sp. 2RAB30]